MTTINDPYDARCLCDTHCLCQRTTDELYRCCRCGATRPPDARLLVRRETLEAVLLSAAFGPHTEKTSAAYHEIEALLEASERVPGDPPGEDLPLTPLSPLCEHGLYTSRCERCGGKAPGASYSGGAA